MTDLRDRCRGVLLGLAAGNALGIGLEGRPEAWIRERGPVRDIPDHERDQPWDDDLAQAALLAEAVLDGPLDAQDLARRFVAWRRESGRGIGLLTGEVLAALEDGEPAATAATRVWEKSGRRSAGNGAVMRCAPVAVRYRRDPDTLVAETLASAAVTHADPRCGWSAVAVNLTIAALLEGGRAELDLPDAPAEVRDAIDAPLPALDGPDMGYTVLAMQVGLWAARQPSLEEALIEIVGRGGDTDTNGAIAGAVLGARHGASAIPERWLASLRDTDRLIALADALLDAGSV